MKSKRAREAVEATDPDVPADDLPSKKRKTQEDTNGHGEVDSPVKKSKKDKKDKEGKKDKKDKKKKHEKESRKERKEKRKDIADLPQEDGPEEQEEQAVVNGNSSEKKEKKDKKKKDKKEKKIKKDNTTTPAEQQQPSTDDPIDLPDSTTANPSAQADEASAEKEGKPDRHIVFVGNLPPSATAASISAHFASLSPIAVRCLREKGADKPPCRGIAFVEFGKVWHMRTCLDKFHHSLFDDGVGGGRKIRVELTAGGGGKTKQRQDKIKEKNKKLEENRTKRIEKEKAAKAEGAAAGGKQAQNGILEDAIHPSRRGRMNMY